MKTTSPPRPYFLKRSSAGRVPIVPFVPFVPFDDPIDDPFDDPTDDPIAVPAALSLLRCSRCSTLR